VVARWPVGAALASWRYLWRTSPVYRDDAEGDRGADMPPPLPPALADGVQRPEDGVGALYRRRYATYVDRPRLSAEQLIGTIADDPNRAAPVEVALFRKTKGGERGLEVGDEYVVRMPGPWDGPVRVVHRDATSFRLATLASHLEAGQIEFRARPERQGLRFEIESWACSGDRLSHLLYARLRLAKEMQLHMWTHFCERVVKLAGGRMPDGIHVTTRRVPWVGGSGNLMLRDPAARSALDALHDAPLNFDLPRTADGTRRGWNVDDYCQPLPPEPPGEPLPDGSWAVARRLMSDYEFADPSIIRAAYHPEQPIGQRDMLLEGRFYGLRFRFGVRVGGVIDETRTVGARTVRVWGWSYRTLQGHLEMGQMDYEVWKWLDTGAVEFRIHRFSRAAPIPNPVVRLGFRVFGRYMQQLFVRRACARMVALTAAELAYPGGGPQAVGLPSAADTITVSPAAEAERR
jgi:uncharacterized protein (UPF0548 family)